MTGAIIQARMGSTRLPGKVLREVCGKPLILHQIERVRDSKSLDKVIVATSNAPENDAIERFCRKHDVAIFRGSEDDVLDRFYKCAKKERLDTIVRLTADCPLTDPLVIDEAVTLYKNGRYDYVANTVPPESSTYPDGSDVEVFSIEALERANRECDNPHYREHVTFFFWKYDNGFKTAQLQRDEDLSEIRFTVDYPEDLEVIEAILKKIKGKDIYGHVNEIAGVLKENPGIRDRNSKYKFGMGWKR